MPIDYNHLEKTELQDLLIEFGEKHQEKAKTRNMEVAEDADNKIGLLETEILRRFEEKRSRSPVNVSFFEDED